MSEGFVFWFVWAALMVGSLWQPGTYLLLAVALCGSLRIWSGLNEGRL